MRTVSVLPALVRTLLIAIMASAWSTGSAAQQVSDTAFHFVIANPAFRAGTGPVVAIDEAHNNFHTVDGRYRPLARLLRDDGYRVSGLTEPLSAHSLAHVRLLIVANALSQRNTNGNWVLPTPPAFDSSEVQALMKWLSRGGSLLLISDHMPFPGAIEPIAEALGVRFLNGFALPLPFQYDAPPQDYPLTFRRTDRSLGGGAFLDGRRLGERIDSVTSFTGSAFWITKAPRATPVLTLGANIRVFMPTVAWQFSDSTASASGAGLLQGAVLRVGAGRVGVFGEAAMFSAQVKGPNATPMGMNAPDAAQNPQFVLNLMRWLTGVIP